MRTHCPYHSNAEKRVYLQKEEKMEEETEKPEMGGAEKTDLILFTLYGKKKRRKKEKEKKK